MADTSSNMAWERLIPEDVWLNIFDMVLSDEQEQFYKISRKGIPPWTPLRLSAICRYWRYIVHRCPQLWRDIPVLHPACVLGSYTTRAHPYKPRIGHLLPRIYTYRNQSKHNWGESSNWLSSLQTYITRNFNECESLDLNNYLPFEHLGSNHPVPIRAQTLRIVGGPTRGAFPMLLTMVTNLHCYGMYIHIWEALSKELPNIKQFTIERAVCDQLDHFVGHLRQFTGCRVFSLRHVTTSFDAYEINRRARTICPSIQVLKCSVEQYGLFRRLADMPNVEELELTMRNIFPRSALKEMKLVDRDNERIRTLTLIISPVKAPTPPDSAHEILRHFPNVTHLTLDGNLVGSLLQLALMDASVLAQLTTLSVRNSDVDEDILYSFLASHHSRHGRLVHLILEGCPNIYHDSVVRFQSIVRVSVG